jgi:LysR family transcriptional regulator, glycine cleavage system transcriptional activator
VPSLPPLNALRFFEAAARHGSFTVAAGELNVTPGAVSQQIQLLEERLGIQLFERMPRGVSLTDAGQRYAVQLRSIFDALVEATEAVMAPVRQTLVVGVTPRFATKWLLPRLPEFQQANSNLDVDVRTSLNSFDFARDRVDVVVNHGVPPWPGAKAHLLFSEKITPVCAPELLTGDHPLRKPEDLRHHRLLHVTRVIEEWSEWLREAGVNHHDAMTGLTFQSSRMALDVALARLGVALGRLPFVADELESGRLVAPFELRIPSKAAYFLVYPPDATARPKVVAFRDWVLSQVQSP